MRGLYIADLYIIHVKDLENNDKWLSGVALIFICAFLGLCFMTMVGKIYDILVYKKNVKKNIKNEINDDLDILLQNKRKRIAISLWSGISSKNEKKLLICCHIITMFA
ncbi:uncharacterized protein LOC118647671 [Monomorium pharaonis]|uniref:uncharacterized protein LOC118647671 n=1 Tax=Monomorium pharaonis TaxID=307658 RepID=UPI0017465564|nr:uncharacterized protein LOC118647671 [Monomorium pharaonis]